MVSLVEFIKSNNEIFVNSKMGTEIKLIEDIYDQLSYDDQFNLYLS